MDEEEEKPEADGAKPKPKPKGIRAMTDGAGSSLLPGPSAIGANYFVGMAILLASLRSQAPAEGAAKPPPGDKAPAPKRSSAQQDAAPSKRQRRNDGWKMGEVVSLRIGAEMGWERCFRVAARERRWTSWASGAWKRRPK